MAIEHALLGLLAESPHHGYELTKAFTPGTTLADIAHLEPSMLYAHVKKLEQRGWVASEVEQQESRPARRILSITPAGRVELERWLSEPVDKTRDIRLDFLLKLYFVRTLAPDRTAALLREQRVLCEAFVDSLESQLAGETDDFRRLVIQMRLAQNQAMVAWLRDATALAAG
jgi:DNA-binding PadR family transcriptional regulator